MIIVVGNHRGRRGRAGSVPRRASADRSSHTSAETGCIDYSFAADATDPGRVRLLERWESSADLQAHVAALRSAGQSTEPPVTSRFTEVLRLRRRPRSRECSDDRRTTVGWSGLDAAHCAGGPRAIAGSQKGSGTTGRWAANSTKHSATTSTRHSGSTPRSGPGRARSAVLRHPSPATGRGPCRSGGGSGRSGRVPTAELGRGGRHVLRGGPPRRGGGAHRPLLRTQGGRLHPSADRGSGVCHRGDVRAHRLPRRAPANGGRAGRCPHDRRCRPHRRDRSPMDWWTSTHSRPEGRRSRPPCPSTPTRPPSSPTPRAPPPIPKGSSTPIGPSAPRSASWGRWTPPPDGRP